jgi:hypothetical protein
MNIFGKLSRYSHEGQEASYRKPNDEGKVKHPHAELIKAWADGKEIQVLQQHLHNWVTDPSPSWHPREIYRIKSAPLIKDTVEYYYADSFNRLHLMNKDNSPELKLTFDGETGKLKDAKVIG